MNNNIVVQLLKGKQCKRPQRHPEKENIQYKSTTNMLFNTKKVKQLMLKGKNKKQDNK